MTDDFTCGHTQTRIFMDTPVVIELSAPSLDERELNERAEHAFGWFAEVEQRCSRFDEGSELRRLSRRISESVRVSPLLFNALNIALRIARVTGGALDPTVGRIMEEAGFNTNYASGKRVASLAHEGSSGAYTDVILDEEARTVTLCRPLSLDLGAVAKGLAIDLAAQELSGLAGFVINAGGDIFAGGVNPAGKAWTIGVRHPRRCNELLSSLHITDAAVCTSGDYERPRVGGDGHHIIDPSCGSSAGVAVSATVVAPTAVVADALSTAAFVLGPRAGIDLLKCQSVDGLIVGADLSVTATSGMERYQ